MAAAPKPAWAIEVFYSYAHEDEALREELDKHLSLLERLGYIRDWHDRDITAGANWAGEISENLRRADIVLLLISSDFLASDYCFDVEMKVALERHAAGETRVIPILLRPCDWQSAPFSHLQCLPAGAVPVTLWANRDAAFQDVVAGIRRVIEEEADGRRGNASRVPEPVSRTVAQARTLDAALPARVTLGRSSELVAMVRRPESGGLRAILRIDDEYEVAEADVKSKEFEVEFPLDAGGAPRDLALDLHVESADFDPPRQSKRVLVPPDGDSQACVFLVTPVRAGPLLVNLEVRYAEASIISRLLRTNASAGEAAARSFVVTSMPFQVVSFTGAGTLAARPAEADDLEESGPGGVSGFEFEDVDAWPEARPSAPPPGLPGRPEAPRRGRRRSWGRRDEASPLSLRWFGLAATILLAAFVSVPLLLVNRESGETSFPSTTQPGGTDFPTMAPPGAALLETLLDLEEVRLFADLALQAGAGGIFSSGGPYTLFAPTDAAFERAGLAAQAAAGVPVATLVMEYTAAGALTAAELTARGRVTMLTGREYEVRTAGGALQVGPARIVRADIRARNGMIHIVDLSSPE